MYSQYNLKRIFILISSIALIVGLIIFSFFLRWQIIEPGYTGLKIHKTGQRGSTVDDLINGWVFYCPVTTTIISYPTHVQRIAWTQDPNEGATSNQELVFNTLDSVPVYLDVAVSYILNREKVPAFYTEFRADDIDDWTNGFLRDATRDAISKVGSGYTFDAVNGPNKNEFIQKITDRLNEKVVSHGIRIEQFGLIGSLRPPEDLAKAVNAKTQAIQLAIQTENEVRQALAEAKKKVAIAEGEAAANKALASSLDPKLLDWERLKVQKLAIDKWNGQAPSVMSGGSSNMLFNIPTSINK